ncbi:MAG: hypothetical protein RQ868_02295 [Meiothermus sp.]|uniref:hypothetical protein n=1 Tax=Meiothermus sp. TaxID=1955249 RepID=UPI0028CC2F9E|nr:hypothetical protein [Meiothermus sp.]MDT7919405.1 hypothetical protein [Meiothermus sp.]
MKVVVTHLTRMKYPRICVAGLDDNGRYLRPIVGKAEQITIKLVKSGVLRLGYQIDLGWHKFKEPPQPPEVEDCYFKIANVRVIRQLSPDEFWSYLASSARESVSEIFGNALRPHSTTMAIPANKGVASLGDLWVDRLELVIEEYNGQPKLRGRFIVDEERRLSVAVTDLRFYIEADGEYRLDIDKVSKVQESLQKTRGRVVLSLGLSRAKAARDGEVPMHWLQINGVHSEEDPLWS